MFLVLDVGKYRGMKVAVSRMTEDTVFHIIFLADLFYLFNESRNVSSGNGDVFGEYGRRLSKGRGKACLPGHPVRIGFSLVLGDPYFGGAILLHDLRDLRDLHLYGSVCAVAFKEEHRIGILGKADRHHLFNPVDDPVVEELDLVGDHAIFKDPVDTLSCHGYIGIDCHEGFSGRWVGSQFKFCLGHDPKSPLGADEDMEDVIANHVLQGPAPEINDLPCGEHCLDAQDVLFGHPVLDTRGAACILRDDAAHGGTQEALRIRGEEETFLGKTHGEILEDNPALHGGGEVFLVNLQDLVHFGGAQNDAAHDRDRAAAYVCAAASRSNRYLLCVGKLHDLRDHL